MLDFVDMVTDAGNKRMSVGEIAIFEGSSIVGAPVGAADLAERCEVQLSYGIGVAEPTSVSVRSKNTSNFTDELLTDIAKKVFPLKPAEIIAHLDLKKPRYRKTAAYGHFGREDELFTWEKTDMVDELKKHI